MEQKFRASPDSPRGIHLQTYIPYGEKVSRDKIFADSSSNDNLRIKFSRMPAMEKSRDRTWQPSEVHWKCALDDNGSKRTDLRSLLQSERIHHVYKDIWEAPVAEVLACRKEEGNVHNPYCVAVIDRHEVPSGMFPGRSARSVPYSWITKEQFHAK